MSFRGGDRGVRGGGPPRGDRGGGPRGGRGGGPRPQDTPYKPGPLDVVVNCFQIQDLPQKAFFHYDAFKPELKVRARAIEIMDRVQTHVAPQVFQQRNAVYDGRANLFSMGQLPLADGSGSFEVGRYTIILTLAAAEPIKCSSLVGLLNQTQPPSARTATATNLLQLLIRAAPGLMAAGAGGEVHNVRGTNAYFTDVGSRRINGGLELWQGLFQSARPSVGKMLINVDISMAAMVQGGQMINVALSVLNRKEPRDLFLAQSDANFRKLSSFFKNVFVIVEKRKKMIRGLEAFAGEYKFDKDGVSTTVQRHFKEAYGLNIQFPKLFGIITGSKERKAVYPAELCTVVAGQFYKKKIPSSLIKDVQSFSTKHPTERLDIIQNGVGTGPGSLRPPALEYQKSPFMQAAGMSVIIEPITIHGKVLQPPQLHFSNSSENPGHGKWNFLRKQFLKAASVKKWAVLDYTHNELLTTRLISELRSCFTALGMQSEEPFRLAGITGFAVEKDLKSLPDKPSFVLFVVPSEAEELRQKIKHTCDIRLGILNQCVRENKLQKMNNQYLNNVALKINARLGGQNSVPQSTTMNQLQKSNFMLVGADVSHAGPGVQAPSTAALVWSWDKQGVKYKAQTRLQPPRTEVIVDMFEMMKIAIEDNAREQKGAPAMIVVFRDGVSEGEFKTVKDKEVVAVQAAIDACYDKWVDMKRVQPGETPKPKLTFVVVGKRHHIRFFPKHGQGADASGNCPAGFIADQGLSSPLARDFYLQSHGGLLGTSRPAHYIILRDDIFNQPIARGVLEELTFTFCHCYASATRSVSIPAPVYYADRVCARAKFHYEGFQDSDNASMTSGQSINMAAWQVNFKQIHRDLIHKMYFL